ncbi:cytochrome C assembly family protein [Martelella alba]|uniref:Inner membrane protein YpjD n=1 Tax=Martelella alba TaxID=2590451 RepID=A0ABY2SRT8_9HYPH|nr:cytochrome c biogenesis protein CcsA [Martelella alba]TKI08897.1 inner membrane protein YpjD [Martelella alba]
MPWIALLSFLAYALSLGLILPGVLRRNSVYRRLALLSAAVALVSHACSLYFWISPARMGLNLSLINIGSTVSLMICVVMTVVASRNRGWFLLPVVYILAMLHLAAASLMPGEFITHLESTPGLLVHIGLALFSYAVLVIAALYAGQLAWLDHLLKTKQLSFSADLPPLMTIERKMFHITQVGVVLLTLTLGTGLLYLRDLFSGENEHKAVLSIAAWLVYVVLLWGHYREGWRGRPVVWLSLLGILLLTFAYFGSRIWQDIMAG